MTIVHIATILFVFGIILGCTGYFMQERASFEDASFTRSIYIGMFGAVCMLAGIALFAYVGLTTLFPSLPLE